ncbi:cell division protein ZapE [Paracoccus shanxieyensis]|uniref:Cell division protein ZapE n=1 Tax=Paracoccus shanxieyensis TaxID=2675752 RepID=A0A6L6J4U7_9RHOB|nr:cell division protein ZapE [Paracoccus shanxieyensis]MTH66260.1 cell division protein ZapE [Paracoccus shanxieyensis]MTH89522.1 cell division protein ZapE [Paracoccus shanxieyensis]
MATVSELYQARVTSGQLEADPAQRGVLPAMDRVVRDLAMAAPAAPAQPAKSGWLSRLIGGGGAAPAAPAPKGLYLWGGVGRGKSMLMDLIMDAAATPQKRRVHFHEFMQEIQAGLNAARQRGDADAVRPVAQGVARQTRLLCFDEMQITDIADAMIVGRLFQVLLEEGVTIVTTSNRVPEDLYKNGLNRQLFLPFIQLIRDRMDVVELASATDHRQDRTEGGQVWFSPVDSIAQGQMGKLWREETGPAPATPLVLEVKGRKVELPQHVGRVARASFWDLCGKPLGPADYLAVAEAVDVLFLDNIPRLSQSNFNEAKRFVTLIDALYEAKVRLIASGADDPERLYAEGEGAFEFERTASRLREMRDADWGKS